MVHWWFIPSNPTCWEELICFSPHSKAAKLFKILESTKPDLLPSSLMVESAAFWSTSSQDFFSAKKFKNQSNVTSMWVYKFNSILTGGAVNLLTQKAVNSKIDWSWETLRGASGFSKLSHSERFSQISRVSKSTNSTSSTDILSKMLKTISNLTNPSANVNTLKGAFVKQAALRLVGFSNQSAWQISISLHVPAQIQLHNLVEMVKCWNRFNYDGSQLELPSCGFNADEILDSNFGTMSMLFDIVCHHFISGPSSLKCW